MKRYSLLKFLIAYSLVVSLILGICILPVSAEGSDDEGVTPLIIVDPYEPPIQFSLTQLFHNKVRDENGNWVNSGGVFHNKWSSYNCYSYAIHRSDNWYNAGAFGGGDYDPEIDSVQTIAGLVKDDLEAMGYTNVTLHNEIPTITATQELICVRKTSPDSDVFDFHFMRYDYDTDAWYHKPGGSAVLKYNTVPNNNTDWPLETVNAEGMWLSPGVNYSGEIIYITYTKNLINVGQTVSKSINAGKEILCEINIDTVDEYDLSLTSAYSTEYWLYNEDLDLLLEGSGLSNIEQIELNPGRYYLRVNFEMYSDSAASVNVKITDIHTHYYTYSYESRSASSHKAYCICGEYIVEAHNIQNTNCVNCGYHKHSYDSSYESANETLHYMYCICGTYALDYHNMVEHECTVCDYSNHSFDYTSIDGSTHSVTCDCGINIVEDHDMQNGTCADCGYHVHSYTDHYQYSSALQHYCYCSCGDSILRPHVVVQSDGGGMTVSICKYCNAMISGPGVLNGVYTDLPHTENGSYILPNGIIVLVPEDEEAYFNGTLEFRIGEVM